MVNNLVHLVDIWGQRCYSEVMEATTPTNLTVRQGNKTGNAHLAHPDGTLLCGSTGSTSPVKMPLAGAQSYVTCSKCRKAVGWSTIAGSYTQRTTPGLDSSAWGINRGR